MMFFINVLQAALVSTFALTDPELAAPEPDEATEDIVERRTLECTMSGETPTSRQWAYVSDTSDPDRCVRWVTGGTAPKNFPSCHERARNELGCRYVETIPQP
ncbi:hypothetical protein OV079_48230 [Nannocystis pusilla]|uniref:Ig-like domain-containing protein n=1 Tax=Nannocystis pusilla TaxID=889268 RepID=A0A9X3F229_9BACT|nr:hypothetical protein [Nannocystis pusilla]MCY1013194.1 hypothetical protein [Nannocystis pusilla]